MSKIGFHVSSGQRTGFGDCLKRAEDAGNPIACIFALDQDVFPDIRNNQTVLIFRTQKDGSGNPIGDGPSGMYSGDAAQSARDWMAKIMPVWARNPASYYAPINEQDPPDLAGFTWLNSFTLECLRIAKQNGYKLALYAFSAGNPKDVPYPANGQPFTAQQAWHELIPSLQVAKADGHILLLHEYGFDAAASNGAPATTLQASAPYLALRYRNVYLYLYQFDADPKLVISEASAGTGYRPALGSITKQQWLADVTWYETELRRDAAVIGCCLYQAGGAEWIDQEMYGWLGDYAAKTATGQPEGDPVVGVSDPVYGESTQGEFAGYVMTLIDSGGNSWELGPESLEAGYPVLKNGEQHAGGFATALLYYDRTVYVTNAFAEWYKATLIGWEKVSGDPRLSSEEPSKPDPVEPFWCAWPVKTTEAPRITDLFNSPRNYANGKHEGIDCDCYINATWRTAEIVAAQDGIVELVKDRTDTPSYGKHVVIRHPWGSTADRYRTLYAHLGSIVVTAGQSVKRGQVIGVGGRTGTSAVHLHFGVYDSVDGLSGYVKCVDCSANWSGGPIDPKSVLMLGGTDSAWRGLHMRADGHSADADYQCLSVARLNAAKIMTNTDFSELSRLISLGIPVDRIVLRLFADFSNRVVTPGEFYMWQQAWLSEFRFKGGKYVEIHNEPNLPQEGMGTSWKTAYEFGGWYDSVARMIRRDYPQIAIGWPGLSPQPNVPDFIEVLRSSIVAGLVDWIGAHSYWTNAAQVDSLEDGRYYRRFLGLGRPVVITEFSNVGTWDSDAIKGEQYKRYYGTLEAGVLGAFAFVSSASHPDFNARRETWARDGALTDIPKAVGA